MKSIIWLVGLGVVGFAAYEIFKGRNPVASILPGTPASQPNVQFPLNPAAQLPVGQVPGSSQPSCNPGYTLQIDASGNPLCFPFPGTPNLDPGSTLNLPATQPQLPVGQVPSANSSYYTTTSTGCPAFYSLADRSKCTKTPKAQKCQGTKLFDMCHAGWKTQAAADKIVAKLVGA